MSVPMDWKPVDSNRTPACVELLPEYFHYKNFDDEAGHDMGQHCQNYFQNSESKVEQISGMTNGLKYNSRYALDISRNVHLGYLKKGSVFREKSVGHCSREMERQNLKNRKHFEDCSEKCLENAANLDYYKRGVCNGRRSCNEFQFRNGKYLGKDHPMLRESLSGSAFKQETGSEQPKDAEFLYQTSQNEGMMAAEKDDCAVNLSSNCRRQTSREHGISVPSSPSVVTNGDSNHISEEHEPPQTKPKQLSAAGLTKYKLHHSGDGSLDILSTSRTDSHPSLLMLAAQHGLTLQQLQQILISQQAGMMVPHIQQMLQAQQSVIMQQQQKAQEQVLIQLNEQLQLNLMHQLQLVQEKKTNGKQTQQQLQQLVLQQQQMVQQMQLLQHNFPLAYLMQQCTAQQGVMSPGDLQQIWKELSSGGEENHKGGVQNEVNFGALNGSGLALNPLLHGTLLGGNSFVPEAFNFANSLNCQSQVSNKQEDGLNPLYRHGMCEWPGCNATCHDVTTFSKHLKREHLLDNKNTAQARVQMQIVSQLEMQLTREKELLHAMMQHLHLQSQNNHSDEKQAKEEINEESNPTSRVLSAVSPIKTTPSLSRLLPVTSPRTVKSPSVSLANLTSSGLSPLIIPSQATSQTSLNSNLSMSVNHQPSSQSTTPTSAFGPMRRRVSDKCNLPISTEIQRNREFYQNTDVRPPFTYASLIRQAIIESENKQLTLNEVYQWFQNTFAYFRRNEATWKNAVRHNLSLHKCFMRVENVKGAVWTVDEVEFYKRRPQKLTGAIPSSPSFALENGFYSDSINASIRAAMEQNSMFSQWMSNGLTSDGVEDLSMKSRNNSDDSFDKMDSPQRDELVYTRSNSLNYREDVDSNNSPQSFGNLSEHGLDLSPRGVANQLVSSPRQYANQLALQNGSPHSHEDNQDVSSLAGIRDTRILNIPSEIEGRCVNIEKQDDSKMHNMTECGPSEALNMKVNIGTIEKFDRGIDVSKNSNYFIQNGHCKDQQKELRRYSHDDSSNSRCDSPVEQTMADRSSKYSPCTVLYGNNMVVSHSMT